MVQLQLEMQSSLIKNLSLSLKSSPRRDYNFPSNHSLDYDRLGVDHHSAPVIAVCHFNSSLALVPHSKYINQFLLLYQAHAIRVSANSHRLSDRTTTLSGVQYSAVLQRAFADQGRYSCT
ncbi:hypothetical protein O181_047113 [Austropuccinia psidii MF-1]|uniref:Uncharacterized protein n=1 Tax=Austropuccinia psidii MF-1 TaxID=1389203 RepID=A0A9Q3HJ69_9BASI|nr:hypothetical protein [Austropuccinia psidii MF-1]